MINNPNIVDLNEHRGALRPMPVNFQAEQCLLAALLTKPALALELMEIVMTSDFADQVNGRIFEAICERVKRGDQVDAVTLKAAFDRDAALSNAGGGTYLIELQRNVVSLISAEGYAKTVAELAQRRRLIAELELATAELYEDHLDIESTAVAQRVASELIATGQASGSTEVTPAQAREAIKERMLGDLKPVSTGIAGLDHSMGGGLLPGEVLSLTAGAKAGKTALAGTICYDLNKRGHRFQYLCLEMGAVAIERRFIAREMRINSRAFRQNVATQTPEFQTAFDQAAATLPANYVYQDVPGLTFERLRALVIGAIHRHKIEGFVLDYLQLVEGMERGATPASHIEAVAKWIAAITKQYGIWAIVVQQLNREGKLLGSDGGLRSFDFVYTLDVEEKADLPHPDAPRRRWLTCKAARDGEQIDVGSKDHPAFKVNTFGPFFEETNWRSLVGGTRS